MFLSSSIIFSTVFQVNYQWINAIHIIFYIILYVYRYFAFGDLILGVGVFLVFPGLQTLFNFMILTGVYVYLQPEKRETTFFAPVFLVLALIGSLTGLVF